MELRLYCCLFKNMYAICLQVYFLIIFKEIGPHPYSLLCVSLLKSSLAEMCQLPSFYEGQRVTSHHVSLSEIALMS